MVYTTLKEPWYGLVPTYKAAAERAACTLGAGAGRTCLVIGSPKDEARSLIHLGWRVTYFDIRHPPGIDKAKQVSGDVCRIPFTDSSFDALSSTCVLCHVGTGRYGDALRHDGPVAMLQECARVLKPGGMLAMMIGPVSPQSEVAEKHRITTIEEAKEWCSVTGFIWISAAHTKQDTDVWADEHEEPDGYLCVTWVRQ